MFKCFVFNRKTQHTKSQEDPKFNENRLSIDVSTSGMITSNRDVRITWQRLLTAVIIKIPQQAITNKFEMEKMKFSAKNTRYREEPNGNFRS